MADFRMWWWNTSAGCWFRLMRRLWRLEKWAERHGNRQYDKFERDLRGAGGSR